MTNGTNRRAALGSLGRDVPPNARRTGGASHAGASSPSQVLQVRDQFRPAARGEVRSGPYPCRRRDERPQITNAAILPASRASSALFVRGSAVFVTCTALILSLGFFETGSMADRAVVRPLGQSEFHAASAVRVLDSAGRAGGRRALPTRRRNAGGAHARGASRIAVFRAIGVLAGRDVGLKCRLEIAVPSR